MKHMYYESIQWIIMNEDVTVNCRVKLISFLKKHISLENLKKNFHYNSKSLHSLGNIIINLIVAAR
jgi:hypothetical protein